MEDFVYVNRDGTLVPLPAIPYNVESDLQELLERHSDLLAGYQMRRDAPRRFVLISRETPVPDRAGGTGRWHVDHLYLDQDGVPTLVEVKRAENTEIRRDVVGQMLDYAANGVSYWGEGFLEQRFARTCIDAGKTGSTVLEELIGRDADAAQFWAEAERNLRGGALRLLFIADQIPDELRIIIEFLNERMRDTEVFGIEVRRYTDGIDTVFSPRLVNASTVAQVTERRQSATLDERMRVAPEVVRQVAELMEGTANRIGLAVRSGPASIIYGDRFGTVMYLYPPSSEGGTGFLSIRLEALLAASRTEEAANLRSVIQTITGREPSQSEPSIACGTAVTNWSAVEQLVTDCVSTREAVLG